MDKIKNQLAGVAALLGVIAAIGGGFVKYGEVMTKLDALEAQENKDWSAQIAVLEQKIKDNGRTINWSKRTWSYNYVNQQKRNRTSKKQNRRIKTIKR